MEKIEKEENNKNQVKQQRILKSRYQKKKDIENINQPSLHRKREKLMNNHGNYQKI